MFEVTSALSGRIRVVDGIRERRLIVGGDTLSVLPLDGDWTRVQREYWWQALASVPLPLRASALLVGLGGGTQLHLLAWMARPRAVTVIEHDPAILRVARDWFEVGTIGGVEYLCGAAETIVPGLARVHRTFDYIMEDAVYAEAPERARPLAGALASLVSPRGALVLNRHWRTDAAEIATMLRPRFEQVRVRRVRRGGENSLVCCARPVQATGTPDGRPDRPPGPA